MQPRRHLLQGEALLKMPDALGEMLQFVRHGDDVARVVWIFAIAEQGCARRSPHPRKIGPIKERGMRKEVDVFQSSFRCIWKPNSVK